MKKKILFIVLISFLVTGVVSAASSIWGEYKGKPIIRITVDGVPIKVSDAPAVLMDDRTMVPIYLLKEAGIEYEWDGKNQTVNIISQKKPEIALEEPDKKKKTAKDIAKLMDRVGIIDIYDLSGNLIGLGSGFQIEGGWFITNSHVGHNNRLVVRLDGQVYDNQSIFWFDNQFSDVYGTFLSTSYSQDLRPTGMNPIKYLPYTTALPEVGDKVYMIGSPKGYENTITEGIVSGIRNEGGMTYIQHTADSEGGSSGGALLNEYGEVIGVHSWVRIDGNSLKFAIPIKYVQEEINKLN